MPTVTFLNPEPVSVEVAPGTTLLEAAKQASAQVGDACGGNCACSTCHVWVLAGGDSLADKEEEEEDRLDLAFDVREESRLACQTAVGDDDLEIRITDESLRAWLDEHPAARRDAGGK